MEDWINKSVYVFQDDKYYVFKKDNEILNEYIELLQEACNQKLDKLIPNSTGEHAYLGIKFLIEGADLTKPINILSSEFFEKFWIRLKESLINYMSKGGHIKLLLLRNYRNALVKELMTKYKDNFIAQHLSELDKEKIQKIPHFVLADSGFRLELSDKDKENNMVDGVINFGDQTVSDKLRSIFDIFFQKSNSFPN